MKKKEKYLVSVEPALDGVVHISTSFGTGIYHALGVSGRKLVTKILRKYK